MEASYEIAYTAGMKSWELFTHWCDKSSLHGIVLVCPKRQIAVAGLLVNTWTVMDNPSISGVLPEK